MELALIRSKSGIENRAEKRPSFRGGALGNAESAIWDILR